MSGTQKSVFFDVKVKVCDGYIWSHSLDGFSQNWNNLSLWLFLSQGIRLSLWAIVNWCRFDVSSDTFFRFFFIIYSFFLWSIVTCRLCIIGIREDNDFNIEVMITQFIWTLWILMSSVLKREINLITHWLLWWMDLYMRQMTYMERGMLSLIGIAEYKDARQAVINGGL